MSTTSYFLLVFLKLVSSDAIETRLMPMDSAVVCEEIKKGITTTLMNNSTVGDFALTCVTVNLNTNGMPRT
jgi:hypothetical protein